MVGGSFVKCRLLKCFAKQLRYKLFRSGCSCEILLRLNWIFDEWHFYEQNLLGVLVILLRALRGKMSFPGSALLKNLLHCICILDSCHLCCVISCFSLFRALSFSTILSFSFVGLAKSPGTGREGF